MASQRDAKNSVESLKRKLSEVKLTTNEGGQKYL